MLTLNNISFSYQKNRFILKNISTNIDDTKITAIAGRNGSGKTTLTRLLMGLVHPNRGSMILDDIDITKKEPYEMAQYIISVMYFKILTNNYSLPLFLKK